MRSAVLASGSPVRRAMLFNAGLSVECLTSDVDETRLKSEARAANRSVEDVVTDLATAKACSVSRMRPDCIVIGADQILNIDGAWFDKPRTRDDIRSHILALRGRTHHLVTAVVCVRDGEVVWQHRETASLIMRNFSNEFIDDYIDAEGESLLSTVGAYRLESRGVQLFQQIDGNYFTILGLPLLPLLAFLRQCDVLSA